MVTGIPFHEMGRKTFNCDSDIWSGVESHKASLGQVWQEPDDSKFPSTMVILAKKKNNEREAETKTKQYAEFITNASSSVLCLQVFGPRIPLCA